MNRQDAQVTRLVGDVEDLLSAASVGLHELVWLLRSSLPDASDEERLRYARAALCELLDNRDNHLVLLEWPKDQVIDEISGDRLPDGAWEDPVQGKPYVAIARS